MSDAPAPPPPEYRTGSDPRTLRDALGCFATGVTVVTCLGPDGEPVGLTANSFTSVSLDPPLLLVCIAKQAASAGAMVGASHFAVNVLQTGQQPASIRFATRHEDRFGPTTGRRANMAPRCWRNRSGYSNARRMRCMTGAIITC